MDKRFHMANIDAWRNHLVISDLQTYQKSGEDYSMKDLFPVIIQNT